MEKDTIEARYKDAIAWAKKSGVFCRVVLKDFDLECTAWGSLSRQDLLGLEKMASSGNYRYYIAATTRGLRGVVVTMFLPLVEEYAFRDRRN